MKYLSAMSRRPVVLIIGAGALHLMAGSAWAGDGGSTWRSTYDEVMLWINFGILAFLIVKYGRKPLVDFLKGEAKRTAEEIERAEKSRRRMEEKVQEMASAAENRRERMQALRERLLQEGERKHREIIESARRESQLMLAQTRVSIDHQIYEAKKQLQAELIDRAVEEALERLPGLVTPDDQKKLVETFIGKA